MKIQAFLPSFTCYEKPRWPQNTLLQNINTIALHEYHRKDVTWTPFIQGNVFSKTKRFVFFYFFARFGFPDPFEALCQYNFWGVKGLKRVLWIL